MRLPRVAGLILACSSLSRRTAAAMADITSMGGISNGNARRKLGETCSTGGLKWSVSKGDIYVNGDIFHIKGAHWSGVQTSLNEFHGLWLGGTTIEAILNFLEANSFNALRVPLSLDFMENSQIKTRSCVECKAFGSYSWELLNRVIDGCAERGIVVVLDMHFLHTSNEIISELWYDDTSTEERFINSWINVLSYFGSKPNLMGIDIENEPHGAATWGLGNSTTDIGLMYRRVLKAVMTQIPTYTDKLFFLEGCASGCSPEIFPRGPSFDMFWGMNFNAVKTDTMELAAPFDSVNNRIVYTPHVYGPSIYNHSYFFDAAFPDNMPGVWDEQIGWIEDATGRAVIAGEWGGLYYGLDKQLQDKLVPYFQDRCIDGGFFWVINPNAADTEGMLLDDWKSYNVGKMKIAAKLQPYPTRFTEGISDTDPICIDYGQFANKVCDPRPPTLAPTPAPTVPGAPTAPVQETIAFTNAPTVPYVLPPAPAVVVSVIPKVTLQTIAGAGRGASVAVWFVFPAVVAAWYALMI